MAHSALRPSIFHLVSWPNLAASLGSRGARSFEDLICVQTPVMEIEWALCEASRVTCPAHAFHLGARSPLATYFTASKRVASPSSYTFQTLSVSLVMITEVKEILCKT